MAEQSTEQKFINRYLNDARVCVVWGNTPTPDNTYVCIGNPDSDAKLPIDKALRVLGLGDEVMMRIFEAKLSAGISTPIWNPTGSLKKNAMQAISNLLRREVGSFYEDKARKVRIPKGWFRPRPQSESF